MTRDLVERAMHGDSEAFATLAEQSLHRLVGTAGLLLRDPDSAQDAAQETLIRVWRDLPTLRDPDRFHTWLYRVLLNRCADVGRIQRRHAHGRLLTEGVGLHGDLAQLAADRQTIADALDRLSEEHRAVVVLRYYAQLSQAEIARVVREPVGTVKSRLSRAMSYLRADLAADERRQTSTKGTP